MQGKLTKALLFIEGRQVPFVNISVTSTMGQASSAQIEIVPLKEGKSFVPRSLISVFVMDETYPGYPKPWVLLFSGEIRGYQFQRTTQSRGISLMCVSESDYWDNSKQAYFSTGLASGETVPIYVDSDMRIAAHATQGMPKLITTTVSSHLGRVIAASMRKGKDLPGALQDCAKTIGEANPFYRYGAARHRLFDRLKFYSSGNVKHLFDIKNLETFFDAFTQSGNASYVSIRQVIDMAMNMIFHQGSEPLAPSYIDKKIASFLYFPDSYMLAPPKCNVIYPDHYGSFGFSRDYFNEATRAIMIPTLPSTVMANMDTTAIKTVRRLFCAPSNRGFAGFMQHRAITGTSQFDGPPGQGYRGDSADLSVKTATALTGSQYLTHEEIIKGIYLTEAPMPPLANIMGRTSSSGQQFSFYRQAADYLFYESRFASRGAATSGPLNIAPVPGLNILFLDASETEHHVIGKLQSITHTISSTDGATTSYQISHAREVNERDVWDNASAEPPLPPWYSKEFGFRRAVKPSDYNQLSKESQANFVGIHDINDFSSIGTYYNKILGTPEPGKSLGSESITSPKNPTVMGATYALSEVYKSYATMEATLEFIHPQSRRNYVLLEDYFYFLGANLQKGVSFNADPVDLKFTGAVFDGGYVDKTTSNKRDNNLKPFFGKKSVDLRRKAVDAYLDVLNNSEGFRG